MMTKRALISVYDKTGIVKFAKTLQKNYDYEIISTGGTEQILKEAKIRVISVENYTGFPEMLGGRVKTLHPAIHGGLLALREDKKHLEELIRHNIGFIDMVVVNLYPFKKTVESGAKWHDVIEQIDIGGPSMLRSAAKNYQFVTVIPSIDWYPRILAEMKANKGKILEETRKELALHVFWLTAQYDADITHFLSNGNRHFFPAEIAQTLRYGENPHQQGVLWRDPTSDQRSTIASARQLQGKEMSFLNFLDADAALNIIREFDDPTAVFIKHTNPCGVASSSVLLEAFRKAYECDKRSAFGVIIAVNRPLTSDIVKEIERQSLFIEVLIAPSFESAALKLLKKKKNVRLLDVGQIRKLTTYDFDLKKVSGGYLSQSIDLQEITEKDLKLATSDISLTKKQTKDLLWAWKVVKYVKSNAIVIAKNEATVGIGAGQMSRVDSTTIALEKAGNRAKGAVLASDAFFPFPDSIEKASKYGISAIIQPGGSIHDQDVILKAKKLGIAMVLTNMRAFKH